MANDKSLDSPSTEALSQSRIIYVRIVFIYTLPLYASLSRTTIASLLAGFVNNGARRDAIDCSDNRYRRITMNRVYNVRVFLRPSLMLQRTTLVAKDVSAYRENSCSLLARENLKTLRCLLLLTGIRGKRCEYLLRDRDSKLSWTVAREHI